MYSRINKNQLIIYPGLERREITVVGNVPRNMLDFNEITSFQSVRHCLTALKLILKRFPVHKH